jgi:uncharacterized membrane protein (DUF373 family)
VIQAVNEDTAGDGTIGAGVAGPGRGRALEGPNRGRQSVAGEAKAKGTDTGYRQTSAVSLIKPRRCDTLFRPILSVRIPNMDSMPSIDSHADLVRDAKPKSTRFVHVASDLFHGTEQLIYIVLGVLLSATVLIALAGSGRLLWGEMQDWTSTEAILELIDRLLIVLMLIEILYTVRVSMQTGALKSEPFLVVGLIACIRRILVISLKISDVTQPAKWTPQSSDLFRAAMTELGVIAGLIVVMVGAILCIRKFGRD